MDDSPQRSTLTDETAARRPLERLRHGRRLARERTISILPTLFTLANLLCGFFAIFMASRPTDAEMAFGWTPLTWAAVFIFLGMVFDGLDGRVARLTNSTSDLGEQLDSMADMVTFGVAPALIAIFLIGVRTPFVSQQTDFFFDRLVLVVGGIYVACAGLRLARFNIEISNPEEADHMNFKGLPSPGAAGTVAGLVLLHQHLLAGFAREGSALDAQTSWPVWSAAVAMVVIMLLAAFAMVSSMRYVHVGNRYVRGRAPIETMAIVVVVLGLLASYPQISLAASFSIYALSAPCRWLWQKLFRKKTGQVST